MNEPRKSESEGSVEKISVEDEEDASAEKSISKAKPSLASIEKSLSTGEIEPSTFEPPSLDNNEKRQTPSQITSRKESIVKDIPLKQPVAPTSPKMKEPKEQRKFGKVAEKRTPLPSYYRQKVFNQQPKVEKAATSEQRMSSVPRHPLGENIGSKLFSIPEMSSSEFALCKCFQTQTFLNII